MQLKELEGQSKAALACLQREDGRWRRGQKAAAKVSLTHNEASQCCSYHDDMTQLRIWRQLPKLCKQTLQPLTNVHQQVSFSHLATGFRTLQFHLSAGT